MHKEVFHFQNHAQCLLFAYWHFLMPPVTAVNKLGTQSRLKLKVCRPTPNKLTGLTHADSRQGVGSYQQNRIDVDDLANRLLTATDGVMGGGAADR